MAVIQAPAQIPSLAMADPNINMMQVTDSLQVVTTAGYLNAYNINISADIVLFMYYGYNVQTNSYSFGIFIPSIDVKNIITLNQFIPSASNPLPPSINNLGTMAGMVSKITEMALEAYMSAMVQMVYITFNTSEIVSAYASPLLLVPAAGANSIVMPLCCQIYTNVVTPFIAGDIGTVQWTNTPNGDGQLAIDAHTPVSVITALTPQLYVQYGTSTRTTLTGISNQGLYFSNVTVPYAGGDNSTVSFLIQYMILPVTV